MKPLYVHLKFPNFFMNQQVLFYFSRRMNKLSRKFRKKSSASLHNTEENDNKQTKISSFFGKPNQEIFKTPDPKKVLEDKNVIEQSPNDSDLVSKKARRLFGLKQQTSKVGKLFTNASTSSLLSGNLEKKATIVQSPPKSKDDFAKKRHLSPETARYKYIFLLYFNFTEKILLHIYAARIIIRFLSTSVSGAAVL